MKHFIASLSLIALSLTAQGQETENPEDNSAECARRSSIYFEYFKSKNYANAYPDWIYVFENCSNFHHDVYLHGITILEYMLSENPSAEDAKKYKDLIIKVADTRLKKFPYTRPGMVLTRKAVAMYKNKIGTNKDVINVINEAIKASANSGETIDASILDVYFVTAINMYNAKQMTLSQLFDVYDEISNILNDNSDDMTIKYNRLTADSTKVLSPADQKEVRRLEALIKTNEIVSNNIEARVQPIATCDLLINVYGTQFNENKDNEAWLKKAVTLLANKECTEDPLYLKVAEAYYHKSPNAKSAQAIALLAYNKKDFKKASEFFQKAAETSKTDSDKARNYLRLAQSQFQLGQKAAARSSAMQALSFDPRMGQAWLLIGQLYSSSSNDCGNNEFEKRAVHFLAMEAFRKAISADAKVAPIARQALESSAALAPDKMLIFQMGMAGKQHKIECWIQTTITIPNI